MQGRLCHRGWDAVRDLIYRSNNNVFLANVSSIRGNINIKANTQIIAKNLKYIL